MPDSVFQRIAAATAAGRVEELAAIAMELASTVAGLESLQKADEERRARQAERTRKHRNATQRDVTLQDVTVSDAAQPSAPPPAGKEKGFICPPPNSKSKEQKPANAGADKPPAVVLDRPRTRPARQPAPWMGRMQEAWTFGNLPAGSATELQPVVRAIGEEETADRLRRYCRATEARFASVRDFVAKHATHAAGRVPDSPVGRAAVLWTRYKGANLLTKWERPEYERIGADLVAKGEYPSIDAFLAELRQTKPWTLADARTDGWAINELASRLAQPAERAS